MEVVEEEYNLALGEGVEGPPLGTEGPQTEQVEVSYLVAFNVPVGETLAKKYIEGPHMVHRAPPGK